MAKRNDKRARLIEAADKLFHQQGVNNTTLANIATLAEVPLGNVYYYFKSKDSIILAVIDRRRKLLNTMFDDLNSQTDIKSRLTQFIAQTSSSADVACEYGDALGSLCQELGKIGGAISQTASSLMQEIIQWCKTQFRHLGKDDETAGNLAINLVASLQGISLITLTFKDPIYVNQQTQFLIANIENM
jgi:AcrR family transcriptional regulator